MVDDLIAQSCKTNDYDRLLTALKSINTLTGRQAAEIVHQHLAGKRIICRKSGEKYRHLRTALELLDSGMSRRDATTILVQRFGISRKWATVQSRKAIEIRYRREIERTTVESMNG